MGPPRLNVEAFGLKCLNYVKIPRSTVIYSPGVASCQWLVTFCIAAWFIAQFIRTADWKHREIQPDGFAYTSVSKSLADAPRTDSCTAATSHEFKSKDIHLRPKACLDLWEEPKIVHLDSDNVFIPTYWEDNWVQKTFGDHCEKLQQCCGTDAEEGGCTNDGFPAGNFVEYSERNFNGEKVCGCTRQWGYFVSNVDSVKLSLHASYLARFDGKLNVGNTDRKADNILVQIKSPKQSAEVKKNTRAKITATPSKPSAPSSLIELQDLSAETAEDEVSSKAIRTVDNLNETETSSLIKIEKSIGGPYLQSSGTQLPPQSRSERSGKTQRGGGHKNISILDDFEDDLLRQTRRIVRSVEADLSSVSGEGWRAHHFSDSRKAVDARMQRDIARTNPWTNIMPGEPMEMTIDEWLRHAVSYKQDRSEHTSLSSLSANSQFVLDEEVIDLGTNELPGALNKHPIMRLTGIELTFELVWRNRNAHGKEHNGPMLDVEIVGKSAWYEHTEVFSQTPLNPRTGAVKEVVRRMRGLTIKTRTTGTFSVVSWVAIFASISAVIVFLAIPGQIVSQAVVFLPSSTGTYYWAASNKVVKPRDFVLGFAAREILMQKMVANMEENMTQQELEQSLEKVRKTFYDDISHEIDYRALAEKIVQLHGHNQSIPTASLAQLALSNEEIGLDDAVEFTRDTGILRTLETKFLSDLEGKSRRRPFKIQLEKEKTSADGELPEVIETQLGIKIEVKKNKIKIVELIPAALVDTWNSKNPLKTVCVGDVIESVNNVKTVKKLALTISEATHVELAIIPSEKNDAVKAKTA